MDIFAGLGNIPPWLWIAIVLVVIWLIKPWKKKSK
jgi:hypothetical protein